IFARITEGYRVLSDLEKRAAYDKGLGEGKMRYVLSERASRAPKNPEDSITHPEAKKFYRLGMVCAARKDWKGAVMNLNWARAFEPGSTVIAEKLAEAQAQSKGPGAPQAK